MLPVTSYGLFGSFWEKVERSNGASDGTENPKMSRAFHWKKMVGQVENRS